jgi:hypothetical protein
LIGSASGLALVVVRQQSLAPGTLEGPLFPSQRLDVGVTLVDVEEFVDV